MREGRGQYSRGEGDGRVGGREGRARESQQKGMGRTR